MGLNGFIFILKGICISILDSRKINYRYLISIYNIIYEARLEVKKLPRVQNLLNIRLSIIG